MQHFSSGEVKPTGFVPRSPEWITCLPLMQGVQEVNIFSQTHRFPEQDEAPLVGMKGRMGAR